MVFSWNLYCQIMYHSLKSCSLTWNDYNLLNSSSFLIYEGLKKIKLRSYFVSLLLMLTINVFLLMCLNNNYNLLVCKASTGCKPHDVFIWIQLRKCMDGTWQPHCCLNLVCGGARVNLVTYSKLVYSKMYFELWLGWRNNLDILKMCSVRNLV